MVVLEVLGFKLNLFSTTTIFIKEINLKDKMPISAVRVLELNEEHGLVKNLGDRDRKNPEGAGLDLRVGEVRRLLSGSFLPADDTGKNR